MPYTKTDISAYQDSNTGIDYVHCINTGKDGPHVMISCLTHGNEPCGIHVIKQLLDRDIRPKRGKLSLSFNNPAAYDRFDPENPRAFRFVDHDLNRVWGHGVIDHNHTLEGRRAAQLRPYIHTADALLDIHSTTYCLQPFFIHPDTQKTDALMHGLRCGMNEVRYKDGGMLGKPLIEDDHFTSPDNDAVATVVECGQHLSDTAPLIAQKAALNFLSHFDMLDDGDLELLMPDYPLPSGKRFEMTESFFAKSDDFEFLLDFTGFDPVAKDAVVARDGTDEIRAPHDDCVVIFARPWAKKGSEAISFGRIIGD